MEDRGGFAIDRVIPLDPTTLQGVPIPPREWLWPDWIPFGAVTAVYGDGGTGKTLLGQLLMTSCASGLPFLGAHVMPCRAFGMFCEDDLAELQRRQAAINATLGIDFENLENMRWLSRVGADNLLSTFTADGRNQETPFFGQLKKMVTDFGARLVVIDTAADTFSGNENARAQVRQFINMLAGLAHSINGAVVLLAHPSLTGSASGTGGSGSTAWNNSVRSRLYLQRQEAVDEEVVDNDVRILTRVKANYAAVGDALTLRYCEGTFEVEDDGEGADPADRSRRLEAERAFLACMDELARQGIRCNVHKGQANYAPRVMREKTILGANFSHAELTGAMNRLLKNKRVRNLEEGPPSRQRSKLVAVAPDLPGV